MEERGAGLSARRWAGKVGGGGGLGAGVREEEERARRAVVMVARAEGTSGAGEQPGGGASRHARWQWH
jgi:hypothetical protein